MKKIIILLVAMLILVSSTTTLASARTITNPANNSALSSAVIRNELQLLENEISVLLSASNNAQFNIATSTTAIATNYSVVGTFPPELRLTDIFDVGGKVDGYTGMTIVNTSTSSLASTDYLLNNASTSIGVSTTTNYTDFGMNGPQVTPTGIYSGIGQANQSYLYNSDSAVSIASATSTTKGYVSILTGGLQTIHERMRVDQNGNVGIGSTTPMSLLSLGNGTASSTLSTGKLQINTKDALGTNYCVFLVAGSWVASTGYCK